MQTQTTPKHDSMQSIDIMQTPTMQKSKLHHAMKTFSCKPNDKQNMTPCELIRENKTPWWTQRKTCTLKREKGKLKQQKGYPLMLTHGSQASMVRLHLDLQFGANKNELGEQKFGVGRSRASIPVLKGISTGLQHTL